MGISREVLLRVEDIHLSFGGVAAVAGVSFEVTEGEIFAIIGPNGAGKTCILNCISGLYRPQQGSIYFEGKDITRLSRHKIAELGIGRTFQSYGLYSGLSVLDNLMSGRHLRLNQNVLTAAIFFGKAHREEIRHRAEVERIVYFLELETIRKKIAGTLPYGLMKRVELGRALAMEPKICLLDEPMAGMSTGEKEDMARFVLDMQEEMGCTTVLVEHDMGVVMDISDRVMVMNFGMKISEGIPDEVSQDHKVIEAYLGAGRHASLRRPRVD